MPNFFITQPNKNPVHKVRFDYQRNKYQMKISKHWCHMRSVDSKKLEKTNSRLLKNKSFLQFELK